MGFDGFYIAGIILIIVFIIIVVVVIIWGLPRAPKVADQTNLSPSAAQLLQICDSSIPCAAGLVCEQICKADLGQPCSELYDCSSAATSCSGVCNAGAFGGFQEPCPCSAGLQCATLNNIQQCLKEAGQPCTVDTECSNQLCVGGICSAGLPEGQQCTSDNQCEGALLCSLGFCQTPSHTTGQFGAFCASTINGAPCDAGFRCVNNSCRVASQKLAEWCNRYNLCLPQYECFVDPRVQSANGTGVCRFSSQPFVDIFSTPNITRNLDTPNYCPLLSCLPGWECTNVGAGVDPVNPLLCLPKIGQFCSTGGACATGACNGSTTYLYRFDFAPEQWTYMADTPIGVSFDKIVAKPTAPITGSGGTDVLFAASITQGGAQTGVYKLSGSTWTQIYPGTSTFAIPGGSRTINISDFAVQPDIIADNVYIAYIATDTIGPNTFTHYLLYLNGAPVGGLGGIQLIGATEIQLFRVDVDSAPNILVTDITNNAYGQTFPSAFWHAVSAPQIGAAGYKLIDIPTNPPEGQLSYVSPQKFVEIYSSPPVIITQFGIVAYSNVSDPNYQNGVFPSGTTVPAHATMTIGGTEYNYRSFVNGANTRTYISASVAMLFGSLLSQPTYFLYMNAANNALIALQGQYDQFTLVTVANSVYILASGKCM